MVFALFYVLTQNNSFFIATPATEKRTKKSMKCNKELKINWLFDIFQSEG